MHELGYKRGLFIGISPVWVKETIYGADIEPRGILGHITLPITESAYGCFIFIACLLNPDYEPTYPIIILE